LVRYFWLTPAILAFQKAEIMKITIQRQSRQIVLETLLNKTQRKRRAGGVAQGVDSEFKSQ
jgi:hypothetical protein